MGSPKIFDFRGVLPLPYIVFVIYRVECCKTMQVDFYCIIKNLSDVNPTDLLNLFSLSCFLYNQARKRDYRNDVGDDHELIKGVGELPHKIV